MKTMNKKKQNSGGLLSSIAALFKGGAAAGGVSGAAATGGIFATKAGILGLLLGGATLAAGAGAIYHFSGSIAPNTASTSDLFQKSYLEEQAAIAEAERAQNSDRHTAVVNSSIGMFSDQAKKSGMTFGSSNQEEEFSEEAPASEDYSEAEDSSKASASAPYATKASEAPAAGARLASRGMSSGGSSSGGTTIVPRMKNMGGLSGGINSKFASMKTAGMAEGGRTSAMASSKKVGSGKGRVAANRRGSKSAKGQALFANAMGNRAVYSASSAGARTAAGTAFSGETTGGEDISVAAIEGAGMGGAGLSMANALKSNNPNNVNSVKNVPTVGGSEDVSPWKADLELIAKLSLAAAGIFVAGMIFAKLAKNATGWWKTMWLGLTKAFAAALMAIGAVIAVLAVKMMIEHKQWLNGIIYTLVGGLAVWKGYQLWDEANGISDKTKADNMEKEIEQAQNNAKDELNAKNAAAKNDLDKGKLTQDEYDKALQQNQADYEKTCNTTRAQITEDYTNGRSGSVEYKDAKGNTVKSNAAGDKFKSHEYKDNYKDFKFDSKNPDTPTKGMQVANESNQAIDAGLKSPTPEPAAAPTPEPAAAPAPEAPAATTTTTPADVGTTEDAQSGFKGLYADLKVSDIGKDAVKTIAPQVLGKVAEDADIA